MSLSWSGVHSNSAGDESHPIDSLETEKGRTVAMETSVQLHLFVFLIVSFVADRVMTNARVAMTQIHALT